MNSLGIANIYIVQKTLHLHSRMELYCAEYCAITKIKKAMQTLVVMHLYKYIKFPNSIDIYRHTLLRFENLVPIGISIPVGNLLTEEKLHSWEHALQLHIILLLRLE